LNYLDVEDAVGRQYTELGTQMNQPLATTGHTVQGANRNR
jgi:hypothetical protein